MFILLDHIFYDLGAVIMGLGSMIFMVPHFTAEPNLTTTANHSSSDNICRGVSLREQDMGLGKYLPFHLKKSKVKDSST